MDYREELYAVTERFFGEVVMEFGKSNAMGAERVKKFQPFQKKNYDDVIRRFEIHMEQTALMRMGDIAVPEEDKDAQKLQADFQQCKKTFLRLCEANIQFYDLQNRKVRRQGATVKEFREISLAVQLALNSARRDMNELENQYKRMKGVIKDDNVTEGEKQGNIE